MLAWVPTWAHWGRGGEVSGHGGSGQSGDNEGNGCNLFRLWHVRLKRREAVPWRSLPVPDPKHVLKVLSLVATSSIPLFSP